MAAPCCPLAPIAGVGGGGEGGRELGNGMMEGGGGGVRIFPSSFNALYGALCGTRAFLAR